MKRLLALLLSLAFLPHPAAGVSRFAPEEVRKLVSDYYLLCAEGKEGGEALGPDDLDAFAEDTAHDVAALEPEDYNETLALIATRYLGDPALRKPIALLLTKVRERVAPELAERREDHPVVTVLYDTLALSALAAGGSFARGLVATRGTGVTGLKRIEAALARVVASRKSLLVSSGISAGAGAAHALIEVMRTRRLDPLELLKSTQARAMESAGERAAALRARLAAIRPGPPWTDTGLAAELRDADRVRASLAAEMESLKDAGTPPALRRAAADQLLAAKEELERLAAAVSEAAAGDEPLGLP